MPFSIVLDGKVNQSGGNKNEESDTEHQYEKKDGVYPAGGA
jgi:hypothetical protein